MFVRCLVTIVFAAWLAPAAAADVVRVNAFPNAKALPLHVGEAKGVFAKHGLTVQLSFTENSSKQREGLASGTFDIAHAAVDNAVAMVEVSGHDVLIVTGGDSGMNEFFVQPHIRTFTDLRGKILVVDAPNTAYALLAKKILQKHGMQEGRDYTVKPVGRGELRLKAMVESKDNTAAILNLPFTIQAEQLGMKSLGTTVDMLGPYQANGAFVMRPWARANGRLLERYIAAYVESLRWALAPANREESVALLMEKLKLSREIAERTYRALADPSRGFTPDAAFNREGFRNVLSLRAEMEGGKSSAPPERYFDLSYYERALASLARPFATGPARIVVPFQAGGSTDIMARAMAQKLNERWRQPVIVENRGGANGTIGAALVAKAPADGHTMLLVQTGFASNPSLYRDLPYDQRRDLAPVSVLASGPLVLVVHPSVPAKTVQELIALARAKPGELNFGSPGTGSLPHLAAEQFNLSANTKMTHVPYKGSGAALADVLAGRVPVYFMNLVLSLPYLADNRLRALGVTSAQRSSVASHIPTIAESGLAGFDMTTWYGLLVPGSTPKDTVARLRDEIALVLDQREVKDRLAADGMTVVGSTPAQFANFLADETAKAARIINAAGIKPVD
jgi:tripartite-type tricarboxylate transporter receptor subunit TctC/ABC-type nitrate/sulfonate/bicarbonate transport system substrate-binding protein